MRHGIFRISTRERGPLFQWTDQGTSQREPIAEESRRLRGGNSVWRRWRAQGHTLSPVNTYSCCDSFLPASVTNGLEAPQEFTSNSHIGFFFFLNVMRVLNENGLVLQKNAQWLYCETLACCSNAGHWNMLWMTFLTWGQPSHQSSASS